MVIDDDFASFNQNLTDTFINNTSNNIIYNVELFSTSMHNCVDSFDTDITIFPNPISEFNLINGHDSTNCIDFIIDQTVIEAVEYPNANDNYTWIYIDNNNTVLTSSNGTSPLRI